MKLCKCGCGKEVLSVTAKYINGHNTKGLKRDRLVDLKRKQTCLNKYGVISVNQLDTVKKKKKETCLKHFGTDSHNRVEDIKLKKKKTLMIHYGVDHQLKSEEVQKKCKITCLKNHGVENPQQSKIVQQQTKYTNKKRYGVEYISQSKEAKEKSRKTCLKHFGVDNFSKTSKGRQISRENQIRLIENQQFNGEPLNPRIGDYERPCIDELQKYCSYDIIRNPQIIGYFPDGYIEELKLVIEFDENWHNFTFQKRRDQQKDKDYTEVNLKVFRISLEDWQKNKEQVITNFIKLVENQ